MTYFTDDKSKLEKKKKIEQSAKILQLDNKFNKNDNKNNFTTCTKRS